MTVGCWGALPEEWATWDLVLGLTGDILPVVSRPDAHISPNSTLKTLGKTPSAYNAQGRVVGISRWTEKIATGAEVDAWSKVSDYGICIQTRRIRAIDIDVEDPGRANAIVAFIEAHLGAKLPRRRRKGSGKCLLAFEMIGVFGKGIMKVEGGVIEFLANGQQMVVAGTHPSGQRYEWDNGLPSEYPALSPETWQSFTGSAR